MRDAAAERLRGETDVARAAADADVVVEREFRTQWIHQGYIEPQTCIATVDPLGNVVVYARLTGTR